MAQQTSISWCDSTFNPIRGCTKVSPGCANCYAARDSSRFPNIRGIWGNSGTRIVAVPSYWIKPLMWNKQAASAQSAWTTHQRICEEQQVDPVETWTGRGIAPAWHRPRIFCASLGDIFEDWQGILHFPDTYSVGGIVPARWNGLQMERTYNESLPLATMDHMRYELLDLIRRTPDIDWLLLTKRPEKVLRFLEYATMISRETGNDPTFLWLREWREGNPPENVWIGTSAEDQETADARIPHLLSIPAKVRFLSCEPLLGPLRLDACAPMVLDHNTSNPSITNAFTGMCHHPKTCIIHPSQRGTADGIHWVIAGGESGPAARPMYPDWAIGLRDQCATAGVPFFFKQWGEWAIGHNEKLPMITTKPGQILTRFGKAAIAHDILANRRHHAFPA